MAVRQTSKNSSALKLTPKASAITLEQMASDENTAISRALHETSHTSWEFIETFTALEESPMYNLVRSAVTVERLNLFAARMYLAGRFDQRGAPTPEPESASSMPVTN